MTPRSSGTVDKRIVKALGHPLRQDILHVLSDGVASPSQIAQRLEEPLGNVSYHVRILLENEAIELVDTRPVRGAIEHFYRGTMRPFIDDAHWAQLPVVARRTLVGQALGQIGQHLAEAGAANGFDRDETHVSWTPLQLDERGWHEVVDLLAGVLEQVAQVEAASLERFAAAGEDGKRVCSEVVVLHFERAPKDGQVIERAAASKPA